MARELRGLTTQELRGICLDVKLPTHRLHDVAEMSRKERPGNAPDPTLLGDALERMGRMSERASAIHAEGLVMLTRKKWATGRTIKIYFMDGPSWAHDKVMYYARRWLHQANLHFLVTNDRAASDVRITFEPGGSWSYLGTDNLGIPKSEPTMAFGWLLQDPDNEDEWRRVVVHEFGHMLDFGHEQSHPENTISWNKEVVYAAYGGAPNFWSREEVDRQVFAKYSASQVTNFSQYDPNSIMHYPIPARFVSEPQDVVEWNSSRSTLDKRYAALWYPKEIVRDTIDELLLSLVPREPTADISLPMSIFSEGDDETTVSIEVPEPAELPPTSEESFERTLETRPPDLFVQLKNKNRGRTFPRDSNDRVPVYLNENNIRTIAHSTFRRVGRGRIRWLVRINSARLAELGAGPLSRQRVMDHEVDGHCAGFGHGEGSFQINPAFSPRVLVNRF